MRETVSVIRLLVFLLLALLIAGCKQASFYGTLGDKVTSVPLVIAPTNMTVQVNGNITFTATGGAPPYSFSMVTGGGAIGASTGIYTAPASAGNATVRVADRKGGTSDATVIITSTGGVLAISPSTASLNVSGKLNFVATGGTPPYTYSIVTAGSSPPPPTINIPTPGSYVAGSSVGTDVVKVTDSTSAFSTASVTVTTALSAVDYKISVVNFTSSGTGGSAIAAGSNFQIQNIGTANGSQPVSWWVFLSDTLALGSGPALMLASGTTPALPAGQTSTAIPLAGTWPTVPPVTPGPTKYLFAMISAADDLTPANNTSAGSSVVIAPPDVKYAPTAVNNTGAIVSGGPLAGTFSLQNSGSANGSQSVSWTVYVSTDSSTNVPPVDASAVVVSSGNIPSLNANSSASVSFSGTWPATVGTYYLKVWISVADDTTPADNVLVSSPVTTTFVDYGVSNVLSTGTAMSGRSLNGSFDLHNGGSASGSKTVYWTAFASPNSVLDASATAVAAGTVPGLGPGATQAAIPFTGTWPGTPGTYYLIVQITAADDNNSANNIGVSSAVTVTHPDVNYVVSAVANTGPTVAGGPLAGSFTLKNSGTAAGVQTVHWTAYASLNNAVLDASDPVVASGNVSALGAGASYLGIPFNGTWPATYGNYWLIVQVVAGDDWPPGGKTAATASAITTSYVDYFVTAVNNLGGTAAGGPLSGNFTVNNIGTANGTQNVSWKVYASYNNAALDVGDTMVAAGTLLSGLNASTGSTVPFNGTWPGSPTGAYYLIVQVTAADDVNTGNNITSGGPVTVNPPDIRYAVTAVANTGTGTTVPAGIVNGNFQFKNNGVNNGSQLVSWMAYASANTVIDSSATLIASGSTPPLAAGVTSALIPFSGNWPLSYGNYYLIVWVGSPENLDTVNNVRSTSPANTPVGIFTESEPNGDCTNLVQVNVLSGVTLKPGMSVLVTGTLNAGDIDDVFGINTGTATTVTATVHLNAGAQNLGIFFYDAPNHIAAGASNPAPKVTTWAMSWTVNVPTVYVDLWNASNANCGGYTLIIEGN